MMHKEEEEKTDYEPPFLRLNYFSLTHAMVFATKKANGKPRKDEGHDLPHIETNWLTICLHPHQKAS